MFSDLLQHVIKETKPCGDSDWFRRVEVYAHRDVGFIGFSEHFTNAVIRLGRLRNTKRGESDIVFFRIFRFSSQFFSNFPS